MMSMIDPGEEEDVDGIIEYQGEPDDKKKDEGCPTAFIIVAWVFFNLHVQSGCSEIITIIQMIKM